MHESLITMSVGHKAFLTCPATTAYGHYGIPGYVSADATLYLIVELLRCEEYW